MKTRWLNTFAVIAATLAAALVVVGNADRHRSAELLN
jgi:hypothetical protein